MRQAAGVARFARNRVGIHAADGPEQDGVRSADRVLSGLGQHLPEPAVGAGTVRMFVEHDVQLAARDKPFEDAARLRDHFGADAVAGQDGNLLFAHAVAPIVLWHMREAHRT